MAQLAAFRIPHIDNEPNEHYPPGSPAREAVSVALTRLRSSAPHSVVPVISGHPSSRHGATAHSVPLPADHGTTFVSFVPTPPAEVHRAVDEALKYKPKWEEVPWNDRAAIWLKAADLVAGKYRAEIVARTMMGQGKNVWQAEIDAAAELADFLRFSVKYAEELYAIQPPKNFPGVWNRTEYRPLDGFVLAISPFNFTAIGGNLVGLPALLGNVVLWKPSPSALLSAQLVHQIFLEAGLPPQVVQFCPAANGPETEALVSECLGRRDLAGIHFTGSTGVFKGLWKQVALNMDAYASYPRLVGETGGKNFHLVHPSADVRTVVLQSVRAAFEYQGQKCSALGRMYVPRSLWKEVREGLEEEVGRLSVGPPEEFEHFVGPLIHKASFDKVTGYIEKAKKAGGEIVVGGKSDVSKGYYVWPTVILSKDPKSVTMVEEVFGPVLTVYVYEDADWEKTCELVNSTSDYALTGAIFATERSAVTYAAGKLRHAAGNFYINDKCTGAVVGQQPFGGSRASGTNDKAGSINLLYRFVNARSIKETWIQPGNVAYPSNLK